MPNTFCESVKVRWRIMVNDFKTYILPKCCRSKSKESNEDIEVSTYYENHKDQTNNLQSNFKTVFKPQYLSNDNGNSDKKQVELTLANGSKQSPPKLPHQNNNFDSTNGDLHVHRTSDGKLFTSREFFNDAYLQDGGDEISVTSANGVF